MSGWIKMEKDLQNDPRVVRMARQFRNAGVTHERFMHSALVTLVTGGLLALWTYADSHIREDDTIDLGPDDIDELIGVRGFCEFMPTDWLEIIDAESVKLPGFHAHNGLEARKRALTQKRVEKHRTKQVTPQRSDKSDSCNAPALPDQTRLDQTKTRQEEECTAASPPTVPRETEWMLDFKLAYPERAGDQNWRGAQRAGNARIAEGHSPAEFIAGAHRYAAYMRAIEKIGTEFVKQASTFLGPAKAFTEPWNLPSSRAQIRQDNNVDAAKAWLEGSNAAA